MNYKRNETDKHIYKLKFKVMKKVFTLLMVALVCVSMTNCNRKIKNQLEELDERVTALEEIAKKTNADIAALQNIVNAIQNNVFVTDVIKTSDGYTIQFSDGTSAVISNGKDGSNAPVISIRQDTDGNYYWTLDGEWLIVDGERVRANGKDGLDGQNGTNGQNGQNGLNGQDAIAPQVRINPDTKEWEISVDGGNTWEPTGVIAEGKDGENGTIEIVGDGSLFESVDTSNKDYVILTLADGTELKLARYDETAPVFVIIDAPQIAQIEYGKTVEYTVETENVAEYIINAPEGWRADYADNTLAITAPAKDLCHYDKEGTIAITVVSESGKMAIVKVNVMAGEWIEEMELRTLTFEDADAKFSEYELSYCGATISTWSDLIDDPEYGGPLYYGDYMSAEYTWWDENNTELTHIFPYNYNAYCYWGGGHVVSNYASRDYVTYGTYENQATVYGDEGAGGHNGSANFCMHFGYIDGSPYNATDYLPELTFADGKARVIDHMWVNNSTYALNCYFNGNGLTANIGEEDWVKLLAIGYDENDNATATVEFYMVNGPEYIITEWTKWDLTGLGAVTRVEFNITGSSDNGYGYSQPAYFAYDDVAVQFPGEKVFK